MSKHFSYINSAEKIIQAYKGEMPFSIWLKKYFLQHKKFGSNDRKQITNLCFSYFRLGNLFQNKTIQEKIMLAVYLCSNDANPFLAEVNSELNKSIDFSFKEKIKNLEVSTEIENLFAFNNFISEDIDAVEFATSFLQQPDIFIRVRPNKNEIVEQKLRQNNIAFKKVKENCISISSTINLATIVEMNKEVVVQDASSQQIENFLKRIPHQTKCIKVWDCCAASGGKSILAFDVFKNINLTVSDIRPSILHNLKVRFKEAGIKKYSSFISDVTENNNDTELFDVIICDVPCSGSGTWSRTPEQLLFFQKEKIKMYQELQQKIISNSIRQLKPNGFFLYITCSVFKNENEDQVQFIKEKFHLNCVQMELIKGYKIKADTMFAALFTASTSG